MAISVIGLAKLGSLVAAGFGVGNTIQADEIIKNANKLIEQTNQEYKISEENFINWRDSATQSAEELGRLRYQDWITDMKQFKEIYSRFQFPRNEKSVFFDYSDNVSATYFSDADLELIAISTDTLITAATVGAFSGTTAGVLAFAGLKGFAGTFGVAKTTGTAIASLHGIARYNAIWAYLGGGAKSIGGLGIQGGIAATTGTAFMVGGGIAFLAFGTYKKKEAADQAKEVQRQCQQCYEEIDRMDRLSANFSSVINISEQYFEFEKIFAKLFRHITEEVDELSKAALERRTVFEKLFHIYPKQIKLRRLKLRELRKVQLLGFSAKVYYSLLALPLADPKKDFAVNPQASAMLEEAKESYNYILEIDQDLSAMPEDELKLNYRSLKDYFSVLQFNVPSSLKPAVPKEKTKAWIFFHYFFSVIVLILTYGVLFGLVYLGITKLKPTGFYYLGTLGMWLITFPIFLGKKDARPVWVRILQLLLAIIAMAIAMYFLDPLAFCLIKTMIWNLIFT